MKTENLAKTIFGAWLAIVLANVAVFGGLLYVAIHFLKKIW